MGRVPSIPHGRPPCGGGATGDDGARTTRAVDQGSGAAPLVVHEILEPGVVRETRWAARRSPPRSLQVWSVRLSASGVESVVGGAVAPQLRQRFPGRPWTQTWPGGLEVARQAAGAAYALPRWPVASMSGFITLTPCARAARSRPLSLVTSMVPARMQPAKI